ncbi:oligosaccharyl transferase, archaeosortase A system-associated [Halosimplex aquaticum]|uniref:dolichyl-phosphooligosaccharide-protein glycotransferase n=1 Tax=Halosimplex aquaticum TaxID=3026162 RepID=A0ABD5XT56_9EURY|nr:oligosaccharyl transferase, archaeosortase A system-associated [Halosimplex aquaticum]
MTRRRRAVAERYGPFAILLLAVAFLLWVRLLPDDRVITDTAVFFSGNDAWYHSRTTQYVVRYFPELTPFDPWSNFPYGTGHHSGFGGLFDQIVALAVLVVGLGDPSDHLVNVVLALAPPVFGALTAVPTYYVGSRLTDRWGGAVAAGLLALVGGGFFYRTIVGASDHQSAEPLFGTAAVAGFAVALLAAYREKPLVADVRNGDWDLVRRPVVAGIFGGIAVAAYMALWPPGVMLLFTIGVFVVVQFSRDHLAGRATDYLTYAAVVTTAVAGVLALLYSRSNSLSATAYSLLQPLVAFGVAAGSLVLYGLSRYLDREGYDRRTFPQAVAALAVGSLAFLWLVFPRGIDLFAALVTRVYSFGLLTSVSAGTVGEIQPATVGTAVAAFGGLLVLAAAGFALLLYSVVRENRPVGLLVVLWSLSMFAAYFTMSRFGYYFAVTVALLAAYAIWWTFTELVPLDREGDALGDVDVYQVLGVLAVVLLIVPGNVVAVSGRQPVWEQAERLGGTDRAWYEGLNWLQENSPEPPMGYYEWYDRPADGDFDYPQGAYGVMSWWDYGHWITVMGHRIPYANPFQEGPVPASAYLQAANETRANLILEALPSLSENPSRVADMSVEELRDVVADQPARLDGENGRYVVIDDQMASDKFPPITRWAGPDLPAYFQEARYRFGGQNVTLRETTDRYAETTLASLYYRDADRLAHYRLVHEVDRYAIVGGYVSGQSVNPLTRLRLGSGWDNVASLAARLQRADRTRQVVPLGPRRTRFVYNAAVESRVKIFEHVEGATITGRAPNVENGTAAYATLRLRTHTGRNFTYVQRATVAPNGSFELTVPYATSDVVAPDDGGTNSSVRALGQYSVFVGNRTDPEATGTVAVPEPAIYDGETVDVQVEPVGEANESQGSSGSLSSPSSIALPKQRSSRAAPGRTTAGRETLRGARPGRTDWSE